MVRISFGTRGAATWEQQLANIQDGAHQRSHGTHKGLQKKDGSTTYDARLVLADEFKVRLDFESHAKAAKTG